MRESTSSLLCVWARHAQWTSTQEGRGNLNKLVTYCSKIYEQIEEIWEKRSVVTDNKEQEILYHIIFLEALLCLFWLNTAKHGHFDFRKMTYKFSNSFSWYTVKGNLSRDVRGQPTTTGSSIEQLTSGCRLWPTNVCALSSLISYSDVIFQLKRVENACGIAWLWF